MGLIEFSCPQIGSLKVIGDRLNDGHDFVVHSNAKRGRFDYLIFLDSRGVSREFNNSLGHRLISKISQMKKTYLLICRPLNLTIWPTLIGFLACNKISPEKIITNMGFVDFTPKKRSVLKDAIHQVENTVGKDVAIAKFIEYYGVDKKMPLYSITYDDRYRYAVEKISRSYEMIVINTPLTRPGIKIEKKRSSSFFTAQEESNQFNRSIHSSFVIDFPEFDESMTYDAVHYTDLGNEYIFEKIQHYL